MRRRSLLAAGAAGAAATAAVLGGAGSAAAAPARPRDPGHDPSAPLRDLAAAIGLRIGSAIIPQDLDTPAWAAVAASQFSVVTPGNEMKWQVVEPAQGTFDWAGADNLLRFARAHGQLVRGHTLCWHNQLPDWLTSGVASGAIGRAKLLDLLQEHIFTEVGRYRGRIWQWDVCNEFLTDASPSGVDPANWWIVNAGPQVIPLAFRWAHEADPRALLFYNDYNIGGEDGTNAKFSAAYALARQLLDDGVPISGVGIQGHLDTQYGWSPQRLQQDIAAFAGLGLKVAITEADVRTFVNNATDQVPTDSLALFAQPYEFSEMLKAALAVPELISFTVWGFTDADSWVPGTFTGEGYASIYDVSLNPKPAYFALQSDLAVAAHGAPARVRTYTPRA
ncbi:MAG TPA: endo-1,4-beta-xylanase [Trebonia sp.]|nr:endo-1,4-beta-xylanase [Trebonia sp.]